jgi:crossover junction endodeoxyribonuclease RusA
MKEKMMAERKDPLVTIRVVGLPAPQGSKRHIGRGVMIESSKAVGPWRDAVRTETQRAMTGDPCLGAVGVTLEFTLPRPKGHYGTGRNAGQVRASAPLRPASTPDLDKLVRAVLDGITAGAAIRDDAQVTQLHAVKVYGSQPGCLIRIHVLDDDGRITYSGVPLRG